jgi:hypothetical protein
MRESESFDAFYARTVANVTSQMHALAAGDPQADHAIREAYARAYQQWFEVSGYRDTETWVLDVAKDLYARRRAQAGFAPSPAQQPDNGTWPGMYRPVAPQQPAQPRQWDGDPASTISPGSARPASPDPRQAGGPAAVPANSPGFPANGPGYPANPPGFAAETAARAADNRAADNRGFDVFATASAGSGAAAGSLPTTAFEPGGGQAGAGHGGPGLADPFWQGSHPSQPITQAQRPGLSSQVRSAVGTLQGSSGSKKRIAIGAVVVVVVVAVVSYLAFGQGHSPAKTASGPGVHAHAKPPIQMLPAGQVGSRTAIPWSLVGPGWALAEYSTAQAGSGSSAATTYLVDSEGGRYLVRAWPAASTATLMAWSGDAHMALYDNGNGGYSVLNVVTGQVTTLSLPASVTVSGFTRPHGLNLLAVQLGPATDKLERYNLAGGYQATLSYMARRGQPTWLGTALSSPDGDTAVWGVTGDEMQLVDNAGGLIRRLHVPASGNPPSCTPISWWDSYTVLASCSTAGAGLQPGETRLWLVPVTGAAATPLSAPSGSGSGDGFYNGAWRAGGQVYATATSSAACPSAASGPGGLGILRLAGSGPTPISVPATTSNRNAVIGAAAGDLIVVAQTACPGSSSLLSFNPATGSARTLLAAQPGEAGVISAVAYDPL